MLDSEAADVARRYAAAQLSYRFDVGPDAWVETVAPLCTPQWLARLRAERAAPLGWDGVVERAEVATAEAMAAHPSRSPVGGQRVIVVARTTVEGEAPTQRVEVVEVELVHHDGRWLVAGA